MSSRLESRGIQLDVADVSLGWGGVRITDLELRVRGAKQPFLRAGSASADVSFWTALSSPRESLRALELANVEVDLTASDLRTLRTPTAGASSLRSHAGGRASTTEAGESAEAVTSSPNLTLREAAVRVRDGEGVLAEVTGISGQASGGHWSGTAASLSLGSAPEDVVLLNQVSMQGALNGLRPQLGGATAESAVLTWGSSSTQGGRSTLSRMRAFREEMKSASPPPGDSEDPEKADARRLWSDDARIELKQARIEERTASGQAAAILEQLRMTLQAQGPERLRAEGNGKAPDGGRMAWDLTAVPSETRVEGTVALDDVSVALFGPVLPPLPFADLEQTRVKAELELKGKGLESVAVKGAVNVSNLIFASEGLARLPVGPFNLVAKGEGTWTPALRELSNVKANIATGAVGVSVAGTLAWPKDGYRVDMVAELPKSPCRQVLASVPAGLLDELSTIELDGSLAAKLTVHVHAADLDATKVDFDIADACKFGMLPPLLDLRRFQRPFAHQVLEPDGTLFEMETGPGTPNWTPIEYVSPFFVQAVVSHEDGRFFGHRGFAEPEIGVALARNLKAKAFKFGASTITMQLVKNVFLHRDKLLARKVQEALIVWWLEQHWDKRRILELYLNVIEYGPAIYGIRNASMHYFGVLPMDLTPAQASFLACILPSPKSSHMHYEKRALSTSAKNRVANLLKHMQSRERIDAEALAYGLEELEHFRFYDPSQPPPVPPQVRGTAQKLPFNTAGTILDPWESFLPPDGSEPGGFGNP